MENIENFRKIFKNIRRYPIKNNKKNLGKYLKYLIYPYQNSLKISKYIEN